MSKPQIIAFTTSYHPFIGGAEIAVQEVSRRLGADFEFVVLTARMRRDIARREKRPEARVIRLGFGAELDKWLLPLLGFFWFFLRRPNAILWGVDIGQGALTGALIKFFFRRHPFVLTIQYGGGPDELRRGRGGFIAAGLRFMLGRADSVTAISTHLAAVARQYGYKKDIAVIPNGVDAEQFAVGIPHSLSPTPHATTIITVSRLVHKNGIDILIDAVAEVKKSIPDIQCVIIGDGPERGNLERRAASDEIRDHVRFVGVIPYEQIPQYLHEADVFVRPSRSEGMGNVFVEALAAGLPIIGTPVGGIVDIIEDGKTGLFVRPDDSHDLAEKIIRLFNDPQLQQTIVENGQKMVKQRFEWNNIAVEYRAVFKEGPSPSPLLRKEDPLPPSILRKEEPPPLSPPWKGGVGEVDATQRIRLLIATPLYPPDIGGPATYTKILEEELPGDGVTVAVAKFDAVRWLPKIIRHIAYFFLVLWKGRRADIIFAQDPVSVGLPAYLAAKILGKIFLLKVVGDYAWEQWQISRKGQSMRRFINVEEFQKGQYDRITKLRRDIEHWIARRAKMVIVPSQYLKGMVLEWGTPEEKIKVIHNAFDLPEGLPPKEDARVRLDLSGHVVVSVGRLVPWKGFDVLISSIPDLIARFSDLRLVIIGSGPEEARLRALASSLGINDSVEFKGQIAHAETLMYLRAADVFVLNTGYEGLPHTILEAIAVGVPIATTPVGGNKEIITHNIHGLLFGYNDPAGLTEAIGRLLSDRALGARLANSAAELLERFSRKRMIEETAEFLRS
ncbi:MAG: glycosyltransferase family 4 protein [Patescibacteria group bacterium]